MTDKAYLLCVDDTVLYREIMTEQLKDDFELLVVNDGQQCLDSVAERMPDLILLDVNMPILNGLETCRKLRADLKTNNIPIFFISGQTSASDRMEGYNSGGDDYIIKPFDQDELIAKISLFLKQKKAHQQEIKKHQLEIEKQQQDKDFATNTAMMAMTSSSEMGVVVKYMQSIVSLETSK